MWGKIIVVFLLSILSSGIVYAEQTAAEEYRTMFQDGNFYLEFKDKWGTRIIAEKNGTRMKRESRPASRLEQNFSETFCTQ